MAGNDVDCDVDEIAGEERRSTPTQHHTKAPTNSKLRRRRRHRHIRRSASALLSCILVRALLFVGFSPPGELERELRYRAL